MVPKKEYEEREADETGTPLERFKRALGKVMAVPKAKLDERERELKRQKGSST
jgi:hypothetical protein